MIKENKKVENGKEGRKTIIFRQILLPLVFQMNVSREALASGLSTYPSFLHKEYPYHLASANAVWYSFKLQFWQVPMYLTVLVPLNQPPVLTKVPSTARPPDEHHGSNLTCHKKKKKKKRGKQKSKTKS